jgi:hypothetical protein
MTTATVEARPAAPWHLWLVGVIGIAWNGYGAYDYLMTKTKGAAYLKAEGLTDAQIAHYQVFPVWTTAVWAIGVWGAVLGTLLLLARMRSAAPVFAVSLAAFLVNVAYNYGVAHGAQVFGQKGVIMDVVIGAACVFFAWYARAMAKAGVLR